MSNWTLFSNHGHVLVCLAKNSESRLRDVAAEVGITERAVQKIVRDLQDNGMVSVTKHGRRNRYRINHKQTLRHDLEAHCTLGELVDFVKVSEPDKRSSTKATVDEASPKKINQAEAPAGRTALQEQPIKPPVVNEPEAPVNEPVTPEAENTIERQQRSLF